MQEKQTGKASLAAFVHDAWEVLNPGRKLSWSWHYDLLCEYLELVKAREVRRLIINVPPRTAKSTIATICFPCWVWTSEPSHAFLCASYSKDLSTEHSIARRLLLNSEWYQKRWGRRFRIGEGQDLKTQFDNDHRGQMIATSVGATTTGKGGDTLIVDDPLSADQAMSDAERKTANDWFDNTLRSRLNDPASGAIVVIMQRLHERDLTGFLLETEDGQWTHLKLPLEAESAEHWPFPSGKRVVERAAGEVLQPERFTPEVVANLKARGLIYAGQYQQRPAPLEGNIIKRQHVRYYGGVDPLTGLADPPLPKHFDREIISADCAFKDGTNSDYVAIGRIGVKGPKRYLLNVVNAHLGVGGTEEQIKRERAGRRINATLIEDTANGPAVIERLKCQLSGVIAVQPKGGKLARFMAAAPEWEAGDWYVDRNAAWTEPLIQQLTTFPNAAHDDMCDMISQAAAWLQRSSGGLLEYLRRQVAEPNPHHGGTETRSCAGW